MKRFLNFKKGVKIMANNYQEKLTTVADAKVTDCTGNPKCVIFKSKIILKSNFCKKPCFCIAKSE